MNVPMKSRLLAPVLAMSMALVLVASASAQDRRYERSQPGISLQINFGSTPHWSRVPGTQVRAIRQEDRTDYDIFQYGRSYYAYNSGNERWYMSRRSRGNFRLIDDRDVPRELRRIPRNHWRNYPASWEGRDDRYNRGRDGRDDRYNRDRDGRGDPYNRGWDGSSRNDRGYDNSSATLRVTFGSSPRWYGVSGTRVATVPMEDRRNYDVFRLDNTYYAYDSNRWYRSSRESGDFVVIDDQDVPSELSRVPRDQWHSYPSTWHNNPNGMPPGQERDRNRRGNGY
jgi:hypothetical protein